jgi:ABC-type lipoprotein release transport system permease subunit
MISMKLAFRNILKRKRMNTLVILSISVGIASFLVFSSVSYQMLETVEASYSVKDQLRISESSGSYISYSELKSIEHIPKVKLVSPIFLQSLAIEEDGNRYSSMLRFVEPDKELETRSWELTDGRWLSAKDKGAVVIGSTLSKMLDKKVGDTIKIMEQNFRIIGIIEPKTIPISSAVGYSLNLPLSKNTVFFSEAIIQAESVKDVDNIVESLSNRFSGLEILTGKEMLSPEVEWTMRLIPFLISGTAILVSFFMVILSQMTSLHERTREIGIIKAIGGNNFQVMKVFIAESFLLGLFAILVALVAIYLVDIGLAVIWATFINPESGFNLIYLPIPVLIYSIFLGIGTTMLAGSYPALRASRIPIVDAIRQV